MKNVWRLLIRTKKFILFSISCILGAFVTLFMNWSYSRLLGLVEANEGIAFWKILVIAVSFIFIPSIIMKISAMIQIPFNKVFSIKIKEQITDSIFSKDYESFMKGNRSAYLSKLLNDANLFDEEFLPAYTAFIESLSMIVLSMIIMAFTSLSFFALSLCFAIVIIGFSLLFKHKMVKLNQKISQQNICYTNKLENLLRGRNVIKTNDATNAFINKAVTESKKLEKLRTIHHFYESFQDTALSQIGTIISLVTLLLISMQIAKNGLSLATATFIVLLMNQFVQNMGKIMPSYNSMASVSMYVEDSLTKQSENEQSGINSSEGNCHFALNQNIQIKNLLFRYDETPILQNLNYRIDKGDKVLLVGASGKGKSTLLALLSGEYENYEGQILFDDIELREFDKKELYANTAIIYQDVFIFDDTVRNNITLYQPYSEEQIEKAISDAGLTAVVGNLPQGLDTILSENASTLSGGERQRLSIARAMIKNPEIIFADEPTASLSADIANEIEKLILGLPQTVIYISHKKMEENKALITKQLIL